MTKAKIVSQISEDTGIMARDTTVIVDAFMSNIKAAARRGEPTFLRGFGTFGIITRKAKPARNICAGTKMLIPAKRVVKFKPSKYLKVKQN